MATIFDHKTSLLTFLSSVSTIKWLFCIVILIIDPFLDVQLFGHLLELVLSSVTTVCCVLFVDIIELGLLLFVTFLVSSWVVTALFWCFWIWMTEKRDKNKKICYFKILVQICVHLIYETTSNHSFEDKNIKRKEMRMKKTTHRFLNILTSTVIDSFGLAFWWHSLLYSPRSTLPVS